jgi:hypothetical protein
MIIGSAVCLSFCLWVCEKLARWLARTRKDTDTDSGYWKRTGVEGDGGRAVVSLITLSSSLSSSLFFSSEAWDSTCITVSLTAPLWMVLESMYVCVSTFSFSL